MTNLTFAELTALMGVNGLTVNDRYFITDKNWTIIATTTGTYRIVVPIVTVLTYAELLVLIDNNALNQGLQYQLSDKNNIVLLATGANTYSYLKDAAFNFTLSVDGNESIMTYIPPEFLGFSISAVQDAANKRYVITRTPNFDNNRLNIITVGTASNAAKQLFLNPAIVGGGPDVGKIYIYITDYLGVYKGNSASSPGQLSVSVNSFNW